MLPLDVEDRCVLEELRRTPEGTKVKSYYAGEALILEVTEPSGLHYSYACGQLETRSKKRRIAAISVRDAIANGRMGAKKSGG